MDDSNLQSIQSGALIGSNEDLLTEILIRLPVISILRFKSVSKHWLSLLTHTHFTHRYDNNNLSKSPLGLFVDDYGVYVPFDVENRSPPPFRSLDFYFNRSHVTIVQSCNGLLLCYAFHNGVNEYYVFNPTTKQRAFIPSLPENIRSMALAFHRTECVHYKVVCVCDLDLVNRHLFQIQVYSSDTGKWKVCIESFSARQSDFNHHPVYWNGSVHWAPYYLDNNFLYFKLDVEQLQMLPEVLVSSELSIMYFGESRGHLHLISETNREDNISNLNVYEMLRDRSGWFVKYRVQLDELLTAFPTMVGQYVYEFEVVDVVRGKEEEDTFLVLATPAKMIRYNVHDKSFRKFYSCNNYYMHLSSFHRCIETLSSF